MRIRFWVKKPEPKKIPIIRPIIDLKESGLLTLINIIVFHPRGYALTLNTDDDHDGIMWSLEGNGKEPVEFIEPWDDDFHKVQELLSMDHGWWPGMEDDAH